MKTNRRTPNALPCLVGNALFAFALILSLLAAQQVAAQSRIPAQRYFAKKTLQFNDMTSNPELQTTFDGLSQAMQKGDKLEVFNKSNKALELMNQMGTRNLFSLADMCIVIGKNALDAGEKQMAVLAGESAVKFAPDDPDTHFFLASVLLSKDKTDIRGAALSLVNGLGALSRDRVKRGKIISAMVEFGFWASLLTFLLVFITLFGLHYRTFLRDVAGIVPSHPEGLWLVITGALVFLLPLAIGGWLFFLLAMPLFLWPYLRFSGKSVVALFAVFFFLAPYVFEFMAKRITISSADTFTALNLLSRQTWDYETKKTLERERIDNPDSELISFALGLLNTLRNEKDAAIEAYDAALEKNPADLRALVNKGNIYFTNKQYQKAVDMYKLALKVYPQSVETRFNLSNTYVMMFNTKESEAEYKRALSIDPERIKGFINQAERGHERKVINFPINPADLKEFERQLEDKTKNVATILWSAYFGSMTMKVHRGISIGFGFLILFASVFWGNTISHQTCSLCGTAFRPPLRLVADKPKCNQCVAVNISTGGVTSLKKDKKLKEIRNFRERRSFVANILGRLLPGLGQIYFHERLYGLIFTFITSCAIIFAGSALFTGLVTHKMTFGQTIQAHSVPFFCMAGYWLIMNTLMKKGYY